MSGRKLPEMQYEKREEVFAFRASERTAAWLRDRAPLLGITPSSLAHTIIVQSLNNPAGLRKPEVYADQVAERLRAAKSAIEEALHGIGMIPAGNGRKRRTA